MGNIGSTFFKSEDTGEGFFLCTKTVLYLKKCLLTDVSFYVKDGLKPEQHIKAGKIPDGGPSHSCVSDTLDHRRLGEAIGTLFNEEPRLPGEQPI